MAVRVSHLRNNDRPLVLQIPQGSDEASLLVTFRYRPLSVTTEYMEHYNQLVADSGDENSKSTLFDALFELLEKVISAWDFVDTEDDGNGGEREVPLPITAESMRSQLPFSVVQDMFTLVMEDMFPNRTKSEGSLAS